MYGHNKQFFTKTNFNFFCFFLFLVNNLYAFPSGSPVSTALLNKFYTEVASKEEKSIGIPIISSTWTAFKELSNINNIDETVNAVADKETSNAKETVNAVADKETSNAKETAHALLTTITTAPTTTFDKLSGIDQRRQNVAWFAESYTDWGFRYRYGGTNIEHGIDCSAFTRFVLNYFDYKTSRTAQEQFKDGLQISVEQARQGDLVFFGANKEISHVAVVIKNDETGLWVVHSTCTAGIHKDNISKSTYWKALLKKTAVSIIEK